MVKTMAHKVLIALAAVLLPLAGFLVGRHRARPAAAPVMTTRENPMPLAASMLLATASARALPPSSPSSTAAARNEPAATPPAESEVETGAPKEELRAANVRDLIASAFNKEKPDSKWSQGAEQRAESRLRNVMPQGATLQSVECRASMCRIQTAHENLDEYQEFVERAFMKVESQVWNGGSFSTPADDGAHHFPIAIVTYIAREGYELPRGM